MIDLIIGILDSFKVFDICRNALACVISSLQIFRGKYGCILLVSCKADDRGCNKLRTHQHQHCRLALVTL